MGRIRKNYFLKAREEHSPDLQIASGRPHVAVIGTLSQSCIIWTLFLCKHFLLFQLIYKAAHHASENALRRLHLPFPKYGHSIFASVSETCTTVKKFLSMKEQPSSWNYWNSNLRNNKRIRLTKFQWRYWNLYQQTVINLKYKQFPVNITYMGLGFLSNKYFT